MNGCPIAPTQRDLTPEQRVFLDAGITEYMDREHDFQARLHGGKTDYKPPSHRPKLKPKDPDELIAKGLWPPRNRRRKS